MLCGLVIPLGHESAEPLCPHSRGRHSRPAPRRVRRPVGRRRRPSLPAAGGSGGVLPRGVSPPSPGTGRAPLRGVSSGRGRVLKRDVSPPSGCQIRSLTRRSTRARSHRGRQLTPLALGTGRAFLRGVSGVRPSRRLRLRPLIIVVHLF